MKIILLIACLSFSSIAFVAADNYKKISREEASQILKLKDALSGLDPGKDRTFILRLLLASCSESANCASGDCKTAIDAAKEADDSQIAVVLAAGCSEFRNKHKTSGISYERWFRDYYKEYAVQARDVLVGRNKEKISALIEILNR